MSKKWKKRRRSREKRRAPRILIVIPIYEKQKPLVKDLLWNIGNQDYKNYQGLILVNNSSLDFTEYVQNEADKVQREFYLMEPFKIVDLGPVEKIGSYKGSISSQLYNYGIDYALDERVDYVLLHQADIVIGENTLEEMLLPFRKFKDCGISCLTCFERYSGDQGLQGILDFMSDLPGEIDLGDAPKIPMVLPLKKRLTQKEYYSRKFLKVRAGDGAMLISRDVFYRLRWRILKKDKIWGNDYAYCLDTKELLGLSTYINTEIYTPHLSIKSTGEITYI